MASKGPPPIVYLVVILLVGYGGYRFFLNPVNNDGSTNQHQPQNIIKKPLSQFQTAYQQLETSLQKGKWRQADWLTWNLLKKLADNNNSGWFNEQEIKSISCSHLLKIDQLWQGYSREKFGFGVQKTIYENLGGGYNSAFNMGTYRSFGYQVGWIDPKSKTLRGGYYFYKNLTFDLNNAPRGHLPAFSSTWMSYHSPKGGFVALAEKLNRCQN